MQLEKLLLKLRLCRGIGIHGENNFYRWLNNSSERINNINLSVSDIIKFAQIKSNFKDIFIKDFKSGRLKHELRRNMKETKWISILNQNYPERLKESYLPPNILFYAGNWNLVHSQLLAVVGARNNTNYSIEVLKKILPSVIRKNIVIVSGLAKGVDRLSHQCTIAHNGSTIAVIGTGLDHYYPKINRELQKYIGQHHLLISEYPVGTGVARYHFPDRNRILAGLINGVIVIEAKHHSGSLITANLALQNDRNVMAVPGSINSSLSVGCNELISAGAKPICNYKDILEEFNY